MALHELATNAGKYGSLTTSTGELQIRWSVEDKPDDAVLTLSWEERGGPAVRPPARSGFGTSVMTTVLERAVLGHVRLEYRQSGLFWALTAPISVIKGRMAPQPLRA